MSDDLNERPDEEGPDSDDATSEWNDRPQDKGQEDGRSDLSEEQFEQAEQEGGQPTYGEILAREIDEGLGELNRPLDGLALSGLSAGLDIGFGPFLMAVVLTVGAGSYSSATIDILEANVYAVGFIFVVLGRSELFTEHTTLAVLPVIDRRASMGELARLWGVVYGANIVGGAIFAAVMVPIAPALGVASPEAFGDIARGLVEHSWFTLLGAGLLAGWLMGLLSWLVAAAQDTISRVFFVWLIATAIGFIGLPHCIAGNVEVLAGLLIDGGVGLMDYARFMSAATLGNVIGGTVFVALLKYGHVVRGGEASGSGI
ncbi:formate/nitrite transporter family protein [Candidatus Halobonum tyrrellensis]|uniref:Formate/nitrite transporter n=1 Tax=Candidatus Halobonum tyrrellensis G22 TaxID=1324957 RepID=V4HJA8_9EURY|nr:formate/nitrite transporter family protein [Candidatus Halobonum tyrrellensis]ESP88004.1 formate/nitrite transporter [Candidatus Halobonum tyrrellensis G22]